MRAKPEKRLEARRLRQEHGLPMKQIALRLGVSASSVHLWTRDIKISAHHAARNLRRGRAEFAKRWSQMHRQRRLEWQMDGRRRARQGDALHQAGCMLYWAEGSKDRNTVCFANSDVHMVKFFARFLRESLGIVPEDFRLRLNVYLGNGRLLRDVEHYWLNALELPRSCIRSHIVNHLPTSSSGQKRDKLPYGVASLKIARSTRVIQHIYGAIQEYAGFEEPRWLDLRYPSDVTGSASAS